MAQSRDFFASCSIFSTRASSLSCLQSGRKLRAVIKIHDNERIIVNYDLFPTFLRTLVLEPFSAVILRSDFPYILLTFWTILGAEVTVDLSADFRTNLLFSDFDGDFWSILTLSTRNQSPTVNILGITVAPGESVPEDTGLLSLTPSMQWRFLVS